MSPKKRYWVWPVVVAALYAITPWISFGLLTPLSYGLVAATLRSRKAGVFAAVSAVLAATFMININVREGFGQSLAIAAFVVNVPIAGTLALLSSPVVASNLHRRATAVTPADVQQVMQTLSAATREDLASDPALRAAVEQRERRRLARDLVTEQPVLADELGIGRPDQGDFDDGGLVDVNRVPVWALTTLPGVDAALAERLVAARARHGPFASVEELVVYADVPPEVVDKLRERLLFR